jgi:hypothetical protein
MNANLISVNTVDLKKCKLFSNKSIFSYCLNIMSLILIVGFFGSIVIKEPTDVSRK